MDLRTVKDLIEFIKDTDIIEIEWTADGIHIIRDGANKKPVQHKPGETTITSSAESPEKERPTVKVTSPLVGTFYRASSPESPPLVQVGDRVTKGQCLCVVEAMKLMNEIESYVDGVVSAILKQDGDRVGYGDPLFIIEEI